MNRMWSAAGALVVLCAGCAVSQPFEGPLYSQDEGLLEEGRTDYVVAVTYIRILPGNDVRSLFDEHVASVEDALVDQPGLVGHSLRAAIPGRDRWTMTVWTDEDALLEFVTGEAHRAAMATNAQVTDVARTTHFTADADEIPVPWDLALEALDEEQP